MVFLIGTPLFCTEANTMIEMDDIIGSDSQGAFLLEIAIRTVIMFVLILTILRLSGRRGVRQLTVFEVAIIISLGSAAGDPMFQKDLPIVYAVIVFACVMLIYKTITWLASRSEKLTHVLEGKVLSVVKDGTFDLQHEEDNNFSKMEFFAELRNLNVEHLGQVRDAVLEVDGTLSVLFYPDEQVRYGLPLFPASYKKVNVCTTEGPFACMYCGYVLAHIINESRGCMRCHKKNWAKALNTARYA
ncbi:uncharacterized membrane protein YcaP (DUF421 family) [Sphingobacterium yanglingense]|uniref:Uncharacterized membrane protein YcaP (DUF421 family) n=2 Tax=Sphingobacterium yanglingense TaxID=1437280 RepID=A0A4V6PXH0_9SPHI|nr:uncharacterized membrane protein YcaP (DUF421 family) [Sphingobacterium yanglingense]